MKKFFYSNKNILGLGLATLGIMLYGFGVIQALWYLIIPALYIFGLIVGPTEHPQDLVFYHLSEENFNDYMGFMSRLIKKTETYLAKDTVSELQKIKVISDELFQFLIDNNVSFNDENSVVLRTIYDKYLPNLINNYVKIPRRYSENNIVREELTYKDLLNSQLKLLNREIEKIAASIYSREGTKLLINEKFLREKFDNNLFIINNK